MFRTPPQVRPCSPLRSLFVVFALLSATSSSAQSLWFASSNPGKAQAGVQSDRIVLSNSVLHITFSTADGGLRQLQFEDRLTQQRYSVNPDCFTISFRDSSTVGSSRMKVRAAPQVEQLAAEPTASRFSHRESGQRVTLELTDPDRGVSVRWSAILRDNSNYLRQEIAITSSRVPLDIARVEFPSFEAPSAHVVGNVSGSPIATADLFFGFENPLSKCEVQSNLAKCSLDRKLPLQPNQSVTYSSVLGILAPAQARRSFLNYLERERAHPYRPFLTYNSWFDIGYENPYHEKAALHVIDRYGEELVRKRQVKLDSFLFDDGWDNPKTLWKFNAGFPDGFRKVRDRAQSIGAGPGIWLSPWGGYAKALQARLKYGKSQGFETNERGFALSGPKYFERFEKVTLDFLKTYSVNQFKIDGTGNVDYVFPGSRFDSDFHAAIDLISEWRRIKPDVFVNLTTGTFPSPFWLQYADSIWRGGEDTDFTGVGSWREKWITYRDAQTYTNVVKGGPFFPLNSLMLHGIVFARKAKHLNNDPQNDFAKEVWSYFGSGTQLQELYITPDKLPAADWDTVAQAANWSRKHADILRDTHWVAGDPGKLEVYGWAAWSPELATLTLRNPSDHPQKADIDLPIAFELPPGAAQTQWTLTPIFQSTGQSQRPANWRADHRFTLELQPFEVIVLEAAPVQ